MVDDSLNRTHKVAVQIKDQLTICQWHYSACKAMTSWL